MTVAEAEIKFITELAHLYDRDEAKAIAQIWISEVCRITRAEIKLKQRELLSNSTEQATLQILERLKTGKPIQYLLGSTYFLGLKFLVNESVLIPRSETEELVDWIIQEVKSREDFDARILDIGTGSGCIPVSLKKHLPKAEVSGIDISDSALQIAQRNAHLNNTRVRYFHLDILDNRQTDSHRQMYSVIVSNPPYITLQEKGHMHKNVLDHEPHNALFVPNDTPLLFYDKIADFARQRLEDEGLLFFEINENFGPATVELLQQKGFRQVVLKKDLNGRDRMIKSTKG